MAIDWVEIDGASGEGGGQILRSSLTLSLLTGKPVHVRNIRAGRSKPGLQPQHLMSVQAAAAISQARVQGAKRGSTDLRFEPGPVTGGKYHFAIGTAGATSLVLHTIYLPLALSGPASELTIEGGTHVKASPSYHFLAATWCGYLALLGVEVRLQLRRPGFYPRGGGLLQAHIEPCAHLHGLQLTELDQPSAVTGFSAVAGLPFHIARRQADRARHRLRAKGWPISLKEENWEGGPGSVLALEVNTQPVPTLFIGLGERGKPAEKVADDAIDQVLTFLETEPPSVDAHTADQLLLPLALAPGPSSFPVAEITKHLLTNAEVIKAFLPRTLVCEGRLGKPGSVSVS